MLMFFTTVYQLDEHTVALYTTEVKYEYTKYLTSGGATYL